MASIEAVEYLRSIDTSLKQIVQLLGALQRTHSSPAIASDRDLDGQYGDPVLRFVPRDWTGGGNFKGRKFSQCPPELLDQVAETLEYFAQKADAANERTNGGKPVGDYKRADAARARGWARRARETEAPVATGARMQMTSEWGDGDEAAAGGGYKSGF